MKTINYLRGVTKVTVNLPTKEVLNRVSEENILLWNARETDDGTEFYIHTKNVRRLLSIYPNAKIKGRGMPENMRRLGKKWAVSALFLAMFCAWMLSGFLVWDFTVTGNVNTDEFEILRVLRENGVTYGSVGFLIDSEKLSNVVLNEIPELSWFAVNVTGSRANISVRERVKKPEIVDPNEQKSVYASKGGIITAIDVFDGTRLAGVGDEVEKGDILVSGITASFTGVRTEHALARVYAQTRYEYTAVMPKVCKAKIYTDENRKIYGAEICGRRFEFKFKNDLKGDYEKHEEVTPIKIFGRELPIKLVVTELTPYELVPLHLCSEECAEILKNELSLLFKLDSSGEILWSEFETDENETCVTVTLKAHCHERIA